MRIRIGVGIQSRVEGVKELVESHTGMEVYGVAKCWFGEGEGRWGLGKHRKELGIVCLESGQRGDEIGNHLENVYASYTEP